MAEKSRIIIPEEAQRFFEIFEQTPMARVLIEVFKTFTDPESWRTYAEVTQSPGAVYGFCKAEDVGASILLGKSYPDGPVHFDVFYRQITEEMPPFGGDGACPSYLDVWAGEVHMGVWAYRQGDLMTHAISVHLKRDIHLPTKFSIWLFQLLHSLSIRSAEFELSVSEQPKHWTGEGADSDD